MTFEKWGEQTLEYRPTKGAVRQMYADWEAEREKLIGVLAQLLVFEDDHDAAGTEWHDAQKLAVEQARAVLAEVKG